MASQSDKTQIFQESDEVLYARIVSIVGNLYKVPDAVKVDEPWKVYREAVTDLQNTEVLYDRSRFLTRNHTGTISVNDTCIYGKMQHIMANGDCVNGVLSNLGTTLCPSFRREMPARDSYLQIHSTAIP